MNRFRPWTLAALAIVALSVVVLFGRSGAARAQQPGSPVRLVPVPVTSFPNFIKAGKYIISVDKIAYTNEEDDGKLGVHFGAGDYFVLSKEDARILRTVLELLQSNHPITPPADPRP